MGTTKCEGRSLAVGVLLAVCAGNVAAQQIKNNEIGGVVSSAKGPEAGVWVIAETTDLPTRYIKEVVTNDQGRYLIPALPQATYTVWARGYGLVDVEGPDTPGETDRSEATIQEKGY